MEIFNLEIALRNFGPLLAGLMLTVELTLVVIAISLVFALLVALGGMSRFAPLRWLVNVYVEAIRGTPLLLQLIYVYYVLPEVGTSPTKKMPTRKSCRAASSSASPSPAPWRWSPRPC
jgi:His/Glu/Gln/Arg/opine family amino acid ABC transporter permease subunit